MQSDPPIPLPTPTRYAFRRVAGLRTFLTRAPDAGRRFGETATIDGAHTVPRLINTLQVFEDMALAGLDFNDWRIAEILPDGRAAPPSFISSL